jgi:hypothetical protein
MKKVVVLLVLVAILALALSGTALASGEQSASNVVQAAMYSHTWGLQGTSFYIQQAIFQGSVLPTTPTPGGVVPPSPVFPH